MDYNVYKVQNSINHMLNPSADRDVNNIYQLSTEKARNWWNMQGFESRKNVVIESDAVINDDELVVDQTVADIADKDYDDLPDVTKQEVELQVEDEEDMEELFEVKDDEYLKCSTCEEVFTSNEDYESHKSVDHGEEPEDFEDSFEAYQLTMHPELTRESLREANDLLTETEERQLYSGYDKNGDVQSSIMPYNLPPVATGKYDDNPNEFFYSNKIFRAGDSALRTSSLGENVNDEIERIQYDTDSVSFLEESPYFCKDCNDLYDNHNAMDASYASKHLQDNPTHNIEKTDGYESKASETLKEDILNFIKIQGEMPAYSSMLRGLGIDIEESEVTRIIQELKAEGRIDTGFQNRTSQNYPEERSPWVKGGGHNYDSGEWTWKNNESKASEEFDISKYYKEVTEDGWMDYQCNSCGKKIDPDDGYGDQKDYDVIIQELKDHQINHKFIYESTDKFEADIENDQVVQKLPDDKRSFDVEASENNLYRSPDGEFNEQWENAYWDNRLSNAMEDNYGYEQIMEDILRLMDSDSTHSDYYNMRYQQVADAERNRGLGGESKATEKGEWDWLDKGSDSKSVDYDEVEYKDDGVSDISIQNTEPKGADANEFLDNVSIGVESVDFVYPTKASEAMEKTYIPVSETLEGDYEEFEDSDEEMIEETITLRKLTGYGDDAIARELHINYGVSHEEALEKVYSVEVSTNDRVSQTFFGKMYKECTESEKDELQMYSGSD